METDVLGRLCANISEESEMVTHRLTQASEDLYRRPLVV